MKLHKDTRKFVSQVDVEKWLTICGKMDEIRYKWNIELDDYCEIIRVDFKTKKTIKREYILKRKVA